MEFCIGINYLTVRPFSPWFLEVLIKPQRQSSENHTAKKVRRLRISVIGEVEVLAGPYSQLLPEMNFVDLTVSTTMQGATVRPLKEW